MTLVLRPTPEELIATLDDGELVALDHLLEHHDDEATLALLVPDEGRRARVRAVFRQVEQLGRGILPQNKIDARTRDQMQHFAHAAIAARAARDEEARQRDLRLSFVYRRPWSPRARPAALGVFHKSRPYSLVSACVGAFALDVASGRAPEDVSVEVRCRHPACRGDAP